MYILHPKKVILSPFHTDHELAFPICNNTNIKRYLRIIVLKTILKCYYCHSLNSFSTILWQYILHKSFPIQRICIIGVMVSVLPSRVLDCGLKTWSGQTKDLKKLVFVASLLSMQLKEKEWLARNQDNVSEWSDMSTCRLLF